MAFEYVDNNSADDDNLDDVYCPTCDCCGEPECCSPFKFLQHHLDHSCQHEEIYIEDLKFWYKFGQHLYEKIVEKEEFRDVVLKIFDDFWYDFYRKDK